MKIHRVVQMLGATTSTGKLADDMYDLNYKDYYSEAEDKVIPISHMDFQHLVRAFVKQNEEDVRTDTQEGKIRDQAKFYDDVVEKNDRIYKKNLKETISTYNTYLANSMPLESFKKINNQCEELQLENQRLVQQLEHDETVVSKEAYQVMWDNCQELQKKYADLKKQTDVLVKDNSELRFQIQQVDRNQTVSKEAYDIAWDNNKILKNKYEELRKTYAVLLEDYNTDTGRGIWKERYEQELKNAEYWKNTYYNNQPKGCGYVFSEIPNDTDGQEFVDAMKKYFNKKTYKMRVRGQHIKPELKGTGATAYGQSRDESTHLRIYIEVK